MVKNYLVTQSNKLIDARQVQPLTPREQKLVLAFVSMIQPEDKDFKVYSLEIKTFHKLLNIKGRENYTQIRNILKKLMTKTIEIPTENGYLITHWASHIEYITGEGRVEFSFEPKLKPYLLQLKRDFTSYRLINALLLNSSYSIRLYELLKKWQKIGKWRVNVDELRKMLGANQKSYNVYGNFKNRVLKPSIEEVNNETDINVSYKEIKEVRKVVAIEFKVKNTVHNSIGLDVISDEVPSDELNYTDKELDIDLYHKINSVFNNFELPINVFKIIYSTAQKIYTSDKLESELLALAEFTKQKSTENPSGFMIHIIREKEKIFNTGKDPSIVNNEMKSYFPEIIPEWFKNRDYKPKKIDDDMERERLRKLIEAYSEKDK